MEASFADPVRGKADTEAVRAALAGTSGAKVIEDYNGNPVLSAYKPLDILGVRWAVLAEIDVAEAFSPKDENGEYFFDKYQQMYGYYDLFLINPDGHVFWTAAEESDLGTNMVNGQYSSSNLGRLTKKVLSSGDFGFADFEPYAPSNNEPCAFIAQPVVYNGEVEIIVALQLPLDAVNSIMQERTGMGVTGESYLVGSDKLMRSDSYLDPLHHSVLASFADPSKGSVNTEATVAALAGTTDAKVILDYNGNPVLSTYAPIRIGDVTWAMISEIDVAEALCPKDEQGQYFFTKYKEIYGYYDLFLINPDGYVFYTAAEEADYQTNMVSGQYSSSNLGQLLRKVIETKQFGFADFEPYAPSNGEPCAFIAQPVVDNGETQMVVALQLPLSAVNSIMQTREGMGETGETYLVGPDKLMRSDSFLDPTGHSVAASFAGNVQNNGVDTEASQGALAGNSDAKIITDYNGNSVLSAYAPLDVFGTRWALIAEIDEAEALAAAKSMLTLALAIMGAAAAIVAVLAFTIANSMANPIIVVAEAANHLAVGDADLGNMDQAAMQKLNRRKDELGVAGRAFGALVEYFREMASAAQAIADGDLTAQVQPRGITDTLGNAFRQMIDNLRNLIGQVQENAIQVAAATQQINAAAEQSAQASQQVASTIQQVAQGTGQQTEAVTGAAAQVDQMTAAIDGIAQGAQEQARAVEQASGNLTELSAAIEQIATSAQSSASASQQSAGTAEQGAQTVAKTVEAMTAIRGAVSEVGERVQQMQEHSAQIGDIVETINDIAGQTNLLALNAAIEAARAGEQGRGFAVVADEVRRLAERSSQATQEIATLIQTVQDAILEAVQAMDASLEQVESGSALAGEAGVALQEILEGARQVSDQVQQIASVAQQMGASSGELVTAMDSVSAIVEENTAAAEESAASSAEISTAMESVASISEENSAASQEVSAMTEEMSAQSEEVTASATSLAEMAQVLQDLVAQFKLPERTAAAQVMTRQTRAVTDKPREPELALASQPGDGDGHQ